MGEPVTGGGPGGPAADTAGGMWTHGHPTTGTVHSGSPSSEGPVARVVGMYVHSGILHYFRQTHAHSHEIGCMCDQNRSDPCA